jgi:hypothetical protein
MIGASSLSLLVNVKATQSASPFSTPAVNKRTRNKINSVTRAMQLEHALYNHDLVMRFASISDQIRSTKESVDNLRLDVREIIHEELMYAVYNKLIIPPPSSQQNNNKAKKGARFHYGSDISV